MPKKLVKTLINKNIIFYYLQDDKEVGLLVSERNYEVFESHLMISKIRRGNNVVDVGANIGFYTLLLANKVGPNGTVYAFEPDPVNAAILRKNIKVNNFKNVEVFELALASKKSTMDLYLSKKNYGDHRLFSDPQEGYKRKFVKVKVDTLDNVLLGRLHNRKIDLIKVDTQGYEPFVIQGAKKILKLYTPTVFMEYWPYGYKKTKADYSSMIRLLRKIYKRIGFIDNKYNLVYEVDKKFIDNYSKQMDGLMHCDLLFKKDNVIESILNFSRRALSSYMNLPYRLGRTIDFRVGGNSFYYRQGGWSRPEKEFAWTEGKISSLKIPLKASNTNLQLNLLIKPILLKNNRPQKLIILVNSKKLAETSLANLDFADIRFCIPNRFVKDGMLKIKFKVPNATSPRELGINQDTRVLGLAVKEIVISKINVS